MRDWVTGTAVTQTRSLGASYLPAELCFVVAGGMRGGWVQMVAWEHPCTMYLRRRYRTFAPHHLRRQRLLPDTCLPRK